MKTNRYTALYGVIGYPLGHTLSPLIHNLALSLAGENAVYLAFETEDLKGCVAGMRALGIRGVSVTLPFKTTIVPYLDDVDPLARKIGAVNTVVNEGGRLLGYNTDATGGLKALEEKTAVSGSKCLIVGAGGAARAMGFMVKEVGGDPTICNRSKERGEALARSLGCSFLPLEMIAEVEADLLVQTTSVGMHPDTGASPVPEGVLKPHMVVMDMVYNPLETKLIQTARERGCRTVIGLSMFIHQGAEQFRLWTGVDAPIREMSQAAERALRGAGERYNEPRATLRSGES
jgi:shikimate dehydrogenase